MYNRKIKIAILSKDANLENILMKTVLSDELFISFTTASAIDQIDTKAIDILVCDGFDALSNITLASNCKLLVILCIKKLQLSTLPVSLKNNLGDIWLQPLDSNFIQFQFQKLIHHLMLKRKYELSQNCLDVLINNVPDLIWFKNRDGIHMKVNNEFCYTVGKSRQQIEGYDHYQIWDIDKETYENSDYVCLDTDSIIIQTKKPGVFDEKVEGKRGMRQLRTYKSPIFDDYGELIGTVGVAHDVTELKNTDAKLELILHTMPFAIMVKDLNECVLNINQKFEDFFQINQNDIIGKPYAIHEGVTPGESIPHNLLSYTPGKEIRLQYNGAEIILEILKEPIYDFFKNCIGMLYICRDVTIERKYQAQLKQLAYTDQLTGLFTRRYLYQYVEQHADNTNLTLLYIDMDNFKLINDTYGHLWGDEVLKITAKVLQDIFPDDICVRMGGDEFIVAITKEANLTKLEEKVNEIIETIRTCFSILPDTQQLSLSIGIATKDNHPVQLDELLKRSDSALYQAKNSGKNQYAIYTHENNKNLRSK